MQRYIGPIIIAMGLALIIAGLVTQMISRGGTLQLMLGVLLTVGWSACPARKSRAGRSLWGS